MIQILLGITIIFLQLIVTYSQSQFQSVTVTVPATSKVNAINIEHKIQVNWQSAPTIPANSQIYIRISPIKYFNFSPNPNVVQLKYQIGTQSQITVNSQGSLTSDYYQIKLPASNYNFGGGDKVIEFSFSMNNGRCYCSAFFTVIIEDSASNLLYSGVESFTYTAEESAYCNISINDNTTGKKNLKATIQFKPKFAIQKLSAIRIKFERWFSNIEEGVYYDFNPNQSCGYTPKPDQVNLFNTKYQCLFLLSDQYIQFNNINAEEFPNNQIYQLELNKFRNPFSTMPEELIENSLELKEQCLYSISATVPVKFNYKVTPTKPLTDLLAEQILTFNTTTQTPFNSASTFLRVTYDSPLVVTHVQSTKSGIVEGSRMQLDVYNFVSSSLSTGASYSIDFKIKSPPFARTNKIKFQVMFRRDSSFYQQEEIENEYQFDTVPGLLETVVTNIADPTLGVVTDYIFKVTVNTKYDPGQKLYFNFPSTSFSLQSSTCQFVSGKIVNNLTQKLHSQYRILNSKINFIKQNNVVSCNQINPQEIESSNIFTSALNDGDSFEIKIKGIRNPLNTSLSDKIKIQTRTTVNQIIEENEGIQIKAEPKTLKAVLNMSVNDMIVYSSSFISFEIQPDISIPVNGYIEITFPTDLFYSTNPILQNPVNLGNTLISGTYPIYKIQIKTAVPAAQKISFTLNGIRNPSSTKQTDSFIIITQDSVGNSLEQRNQGLTVKMTKRAKTINVEIIPGNQYTGANNVDYVFKITLKVPQTGKNTFNLTFPPEVTLNTAITCNVLIGITDIVCTKSLNALSAVVTIAKFPSDNIVSFVVKTANNYIVSGAYVFQFFSKNGTGDDIEESLDIKYTLNPSPFNSATGNNIKTKMTKTDNTYSIKINPKTQFPSNSPATSVEIILPKQAYILANSQCQMTSPTNLSCVKDDATNKFKCQPAGQFDKPIEITITNFGFNYVANGKSDSIIVSTAYNGNPIDQASSGLELIHNCDPNCLECNPLNSPQCTACFQSSNTSSYLLQGKTCKTKCDPGYVAINGNQVCQVCENDCATCSDTKQNCTSCTGIFYLEGSNCVKTCSPGYYGDKQQNKCIKCSPPCETCESTSSYCITCINNNSNVNIYSYQGSCVSDCPTDKSVKQGNKCLPCANNCIKCQNDPNNCQLCKDPYILSGSVCVSTCPSSTYPNDGKCQKCFDPCVTCSGTPSYCTSCKAPFYVSNGTCVNAPCPSSTYQVDANRSCNNCSKGCLSCTSDIECKNCDTAGGFPILFNKQCLAECPQDRPLKTSNGCEECAESCLLCQSAKDFCTACKSPLYLYSGQCVSDCPSGFVKDSSTNTCENPVYRETKIYFPYLIGAFIFLGVTAVSKVMVKQSQFFTNATAFTSIFEFLSWLTTGILQFNYNNAYEERDIKTTLGIFWFGFVTYLITNIVAFIYIQMKFLKDLKYLTWKSQSTAHQHSSKIIQAFTLIFTFKFFRFMYGRFLNRTYLNSRFKDNNTIFKPTNFLSILSFMLSSIFIIAGASLSCYETQLIKDNLYYFSIETIILTLIMLFLIIADIFKEQDYFNYDLPLDKRSRVYIDDGSAKKDPLMSVDVRNELEKSVLEKSLAYDNLNRSNYDRLNNSNLKNTGLLNKSRTKNGLSSLQEIEGGDLNDNSLYNSALNSSHKMDSEKKQKNGFANEGDEDENGKSKKNSKNGKSKNGANSQQSLANKNIDQNKRAISSENLSKSKAFVNHQTQTQPDGFRDYDDLNNYKKTKSQQSLNSLKKNKSRSQSPERLDKKLSNKGNLSPNRSPSNNTKNKLFDSTKKNPEDNNGDSKLSGRECHHLIRVYERDGKNNKLNQSKDNVNSSPRKKTKSPERKVNKKKSPKKNQQSKDSKNQNSHLIGQDEEGFDNQNGNEVEGNLKRKDFKNNINDPSNLYNPYNVNAQNNQNGGRSVSVKKNKKILEDFGGVDDGESDNNSFIQDTPSNYNFLNMRFETKDLVQMQQSNPHQNNLLAQSGLKTIPSNSQPLNYGLPNQMFDHGYSSTYSQNQSPLRNSQIQNALINTQQSPTRLSQTMSVKNQNNHIKGKKKFSNKQLSITPSHQNYSHNTSPMRSVVNGNYYSITPSSNTFANNGQNIIKSNSDYEESIRISKMLEQNSSRNGIHQGGQPFFRSQNVSQSVQASKQKQDYLDNFDYSIPQAQVNYKNDFNSESSKIRDLSNPRMATHGPSRTSKTLENDPRVKQLEDIYNQKLAPFQNIRNSQQSINSRRTNKKSPNSLIICDADNFSDYEGDANPGYF